MDALEGHFMKITYFGYFKEGLPIPDNDILYSLKKEHEVYPCDIRKFDDKDLLQIIEKANKSDMFLFHGSIGEYDDLTFAMILNRISVLLDSIKCKKVMWFFDKIIGSRIKIITTLLDKIDYIFVNDDTWLRRFDSDKIFPLHMGCPDKFYKGKFDPELECDVAFVGNLYGERIKMYEALKKKFGERFKMFDDQYGKKFADLCKSVKVIVAPQFPFDDFCWSDRIYTTLSNGGVMVHPRTYGLEDEGFKEGEHYFSYYAEPEMFTIISALLSDKTIRKGLSVMGQDFVRKNFKYSDRINKIIQKINENQSVQ
jgi:hypothetical protein